jgi:hypothetical protein
MIQIVIEGSVIKGYHHFKIRPPLQLKLRIDLEYTNIKDENALLVWLPEVDDLNYADLNMITDTAKCLTLRDIAGLPVGHVPRGLAPVYRAVIEAGGDITAVATGEPCQSFPPWPAPYETGGGAVVPCCYTVKTMDDGHVALIKETLKKMPEGQAMMMTVSET